MERKEILEKLKSSEAKIRKKTEEAHKKGNELILQAMTKAKKLEEENEQIMKKENEKMFSNVKKELEKERQKIIKKVLAETQNLKQKAHGDDAKEYFISKFQEYINVQAN